MSDDELQRVIGKARRLKELRRAKERVRQLERELRGEPARPEESPWVPEFLRVLISPASTEANDRTRELSQPRSARRVPEPPFGRRSVRDLAEWTSASRGPLAEP
jgi:hypothetical protein